MAATFGELAWVLTVNTPAFVEDFCSGVVMDLASPSYNGEDGDETDHSEPNSPQSSSVMSPNAKNLAAGGTAPATHAELCAKVREFHALATKAQALSHDDEEFSLLRVRTVEAKAVLADKALEVRDALLERLVEDSAATNARVAAEYDSMLETLANVPTDETELAKLQAFIEGAPEQVDNLVTECYGVHDRLALLDEFRYLMSEEDGWLNWRTLAYPEKVKDAIREANQIQQERQTALLEGLNNEKEAFVALLEKFKEDLATCKGFGDYDEWEDSSSRVNELFDSLQAAKETVADFNMREEIFKFPPTEYPTIDVVEKELDTPFKLWNMIADFNTNEQNWMKGSFMEIDAPQVETDVTDWFKTAGKMAKLLADDFPEASSCAKKLREVTGDFRKHLPIMVALATPALKPRHWEQLSDLLGRPADETIEPNSDLTLEDLLSWGVDEYVTEIEEISVHASKQYGLEKNLAAMKEEWSPIEFEVKDYRSTGTCIIGGLDDIITLLDEHIVKTQTMSGSPFAKGIKDECDGWAHQLLYGQEMLDEWIKVQRTWM